MKKYRVKKSVLGLPAGIEFKETKKGYKADFKDGDWIGCLKSIIENNPEWFEEIENNHYFDIGDIFVHKSSGKEYYVCGLLKNVESKIIQPLLRHEAND